MVSEEVLALTEDPTKHNTRYKMGSDESYCNVSLIVRDKVTKRMSTDNNCSRERRAEAESNRGPAYQPYR